MLILLSLTLILTLKFFFMTYASIDFSDEKNFVCFSVSLYQDKI